MSLVGSTFKAFLLQISLLRTLFDFLQALGSAVSAMIEDQKGHLGKRGGQCFEDLFLKARLSSLKKRNPGLYKEGLEYQLVSLACEGSRVVFAGVCAAVRAVKSVSSSIEGSKSRCLSVRVARKALRLLRRAAKSDLTWRAAELCFEMLVCGSLRAYHHLARLARVFAEGPVESERSGSEEQRPQSAGKIGNCRRCRAFYARLAELGPCGRPPVEAENQGKSPLRWIAEEGILKSLFLGFAPLGQQRESSVASQVESFDVRDIKTISDL